MGNDPKAMNIIAQYMQQRSRTPPPATAAAASAAATATSKSSYAGATKSNTNDSNAATANSQSKAVAPGANDKSASGWLVTHFDEPSSSSGGSKQPKVRDDEVTFCNVNVSASYQIYGKSILQPNT